jgi:GST-like protein
MHTLFGYRGSGSAAVEIALEQCGVPYRRIDAAEWRSRSAMTELQKRNPLGQIPTLELPDGAVLTESAAILIHLGLAYPAANILPQEPAQRTRSIRGLVYIAANCYSAVGIIDYPERWCADADEATNERIRRAARARLHQYWDIFADQFQAQPYLSGTTPGALDFLAAVVSKWSGARSHLQRSRPEFYATLKRIENHPSVAPVFARHWPA